MSVMNIKRFRTVCRISSVVLKLFVVLSILLVVYTFYRIYFTTGNYWFNYNGPSIPIYSMGGSKNGIMITQNEERLASLIITPLTVIVSSYALLKGSQIFAGLGKGETPFSEKFAKSLKHLSIVLIASDIIIPILYSAVLSFIYEDGYQFTIGVSSGFLIGMILYVISGIFYYGIELQHLADETV